MSPQCRTRLLRPVAVDRNDSRGIMERDPDRQVMERAYARWAPVYDVLCGPVFVNGRRAATRAAREVGGRILEIGVGTGLSFDDYDPTTEITGIDISGPMIARAHERLKSGRCRTVARAKGAQARPAAGISVSAPCRLGADAWGRRGDRTTQGKTVRCVYLGAISTRRGTKRRRMNPEEYQIGKRHCHKTEKTG